MNSPIALSTLGIDETATIEQIKQAYRNRALTTHPDRIADIYDDSMFLLVKEAYQLLMDMKEISTESRGLFCGTFLTILT